jgi:phage repressor protein C with HTH and peptisase S24 domain
MSKMDSREERLVEARRNAGFPSASEAAQQFGWTVSTYLGHENGSRGITASKAEVYARAFKVSPEWLLYGASKSAPPQASPKAASDDMPHDLVPVYDVFASAGDGVLVLSEDHVESMAFPAGYLRWLTRANPRDLAIIGVKGDSMHPTLADDDVVMLDRSKRDLSYDGLFVIRDNGDALLVKRIGRARTPGHVTVISDNRALYDPVEKALKDIEVIGKVIWAGGKV